MLHRPGGEIGFELQEGSLSSLTPPAASLTFGTTYRLAASGGVPATIALSTRERQAASPALRPVPVYFIGVSEKLEDLETFNAREFAQAADGLNSCSLDAIYLLADAARIHRAAGIFDT